MKILTLVKRVEDPEMKIKLTPDGSGLITDGMKYVVNPFDEIAVEESLRIRDTKGGEVVVVTVGVKEASQQLRTALAMGADRAVHIVSDTPLDPCVVAQAVSTLVAEEKPDLVIMGKQAIDDDMGQTGALLAEKLGWAQATCASKEASLESEDEKNKVPALKFEGERVEVVREVDGGIETLSLSLPAVVTCELRLNVPRYASVPGIMKAKRKEIRERPLKELAPQSAPKVRVITMEPPQARKAGVMVKDMSELLNKLRAEAKVI